MILQHKTLPLIFLALSVAGVIVFAQPPHDPKWSANWYQVNWEREKFEKKIPTDTIYIHHTAWTPGATWQRLSEEQKKRLYEARYNIADPDPLVKGQEPYSGHFRYDDKGVLVEVFYAYHYWVRADGKLAERLLQDTEVGWHAGNWDENMRSLAIVFDGDYSGAWPSDAALQMAAGQIAEYCRRFPIKRLRGHYDARKGTECPGKWFDEKGPDGLTGREKLLKLAGVQLARE
jgi:N-acetylmuramoyl-L-alanine amidase